MEEFPSFPYKPYDIQLQFMRNLYQVLEKGHIGLFESPTGTGKTLSLLCGALTWLESHRELGSPATAEEEQDDDMPAWLREGTTTVGNTAKRSRPTDSSSDADDDALPTQPAKRQLLFCRCVVLSCGSHIFTMHTICTPFKPSRTHSQLSQVVSELHRTPFASSMSAVVLASRGVLCVNESVRSLGSGAAVNDRCQDLVAKHSGKGTSKRVCNSHGANETMDDLTIASDNKENRNGTCPFYNQVKVRALQDALLGTPMDVEDLGTLGRRMGGCPYFAARRAIHEADVVLLPYNAVLIKVCCVLCVCCTEYCVPTTIKHTGNTAGTRCCH